jgi:D-aminopeptidase
VVVTDAILSKAQIKRLAVMAQDGLARALYPIHTPIDGDIVFAASTRRKPLTDPAVGLAELGAVAADTVARAVARGVFEAHPLPFPDALPSWQGLFGPTRSA